MAKFTLDYTGEQINEALGLALNGSTDALKKTGDTMEGVLKFTPDVHYGASLPETGETGQIYFVEAEEAFLENKDGVIKTSNVENKSITRVKLANDVLYSPIVPLNDTNKDYIITDADIGKTLTPGLSSVVYTITLSQEVSSTLPRGTEIAICFMYGTSVTVITDGVKVCIPGGATSSTNVRLSVPQFHTIALKKMFSLETGDIWLVIGNVEVVS